MNPGSLVDISRLDEHQPAVNIRNEHIEWKLLEFLETKKAGFIERHGEAILLSGLALGAGVALCILGFAAVR
jgi:hypothetical protein